MYKAISKFIMLIKEGARKYLMSLRDEAQLCLRKFTGNLGVFPIHFSLGGLSWAFSCIKNLHTLLYYVKPSNITL